MIVWFSRILYATAEIIDAFVLLSDKFNNSLSYRRQWRLYLRRPPASETLWIHGASAGELEDLAAFFSNENNLKAIGFSHKQLILTSSSVSADSKLKLWGNKFNLCYAGPIPPESRSNCAEFFKRLKPKLLILSHSDVWPTLFSEAARTKKLKALWLPAKNKDLGYVRKSLLKKILLHIGLRNKSDSFDFRVEQSFIGNPRIDRVLERIKIETTSTQHVLDFDQCQPKLGFINIIIGSAWREDAQFLSKAIQRLKPETIEKLNIVLIPHDPQNSHEVALIKNQLSFAQISLTEGILLEAYKGFSLAFVGGGFRTGLHSILEPALWGLPVLCGPKLEKQPEAKTLGESRQLFSYSNPQDLALFLENFSSDQNFQKEILEGCKVSRDKLSSARGANIRLVETIKSLNLPG
ncbi:hypothetical protein GW915_12840 [bacterium]|nr:hypothetical protein [bacterium]